MVSWRISRNSPNKPNEIGKRRTADINFVMAGSRSIAHMSQMRLRKPRERPGVIIFLGRYPTLRNTLDNYDRSKDCVGSASVQRSRRDTNENVEMRRRASYGDHISRLCRGGRARKRKRRGKRQGTGVKIVISAITGLLRGARNNRSFDRMNYLNASPLLSNCRNSVAERYSAGTASGLIDVSKAVFNGRTLSRDRSGPQDLPFGIPKESPGRPREASHLLSRRLDDGYSSRVYGLTGGKLVLGARPRKFKTVLTYLSRAVAHFWHATRSHLPCPSAPLRARARALARPRKIECLVLRGRI